MFFPRLLYPWLLIIGLVSCTSFPVKTAQPPTATATETSRNNRLLIKNQWFYQDETRLGIEFVIKNYPMPLGYHTRCPLTRLEIEQNGKKELLYRNPEQISLKNFYHQTHDNRWDCRQTASRKGYVDYVFSLSHDFTDNQDLQSETRATLHIELGAVTATNEMSRITLSPQGNFAIPITSQQPNHLLTWKAPGMVKKNGIKVAIQQVDANPSTTFLDACLEYDDHNFWNPRAAILYKDQKTFSLKWVPTSPYPFDRDTMLKSTRRCFSFAIPFVFNFSSSIRIGIDRVIVDKSDPGTLTMEECETIVNEVKNTQPGWEIRCNAYETFGKTQHWFEILAHPPSLTNEQAYQTVKSAFRTTLTGPWFIILVPQP